MSALNKLSQKVESYFENRTNCGEGIKSLICGMEPKNGDLILNHNDFFNLSGDERLVKSQISNLNNNSNSLFMSGVFLINDKNTVEQNFADYLGFESCYISQSGWNANVGLIQTIADKNDVVYIDYFAHMSLREGIKSSGAKCVVFRHNDMEDLELKIKKNGPGVILVDSIYSSIGSVCCLQKVVNVGKSFGCVIVVDESHSLGIIGPKGSGMVADLGLENDVDFITSSLSKAFCMRSGLVAGKKRNIDYIKENSLPAIFSSTILPHELARLSETLEIIKNSDDVRAKMDKTRIDIINNLEEIGYPVSHIDSHIISIIPGEEEYTVELRDHLEEKGIFGSVFIAPATTKNGALVRCSLNASILEDGQSERFINAFRELSIKIDIKKWIYQKQIYMSNSIGLVA